MQAARIEDAFHPFVAGVGARGREFVTVGHSDDVLDTFRAKFRSSLRSRSKMPRRCDADALVSRSVRLAGSFARVGHGQQVRIGMLNSSQTLGSFDDPPQALIVKLVTRGASRAPAKCGPYRDGVVFFRNVLMNRVVGKSGERESSTS